MSTAIAVPILTARAQRINAAHHNALAAGRSMLAYAVEAGRELIEAKRGLPHGAFQPWCETHLSFGHRQAQKYMRVAKCEPQGAFEGGINAFLEAAAQPRALEAPKLTHNDAARILKLAAMANGGNANEEAVAQEGSTLNCFQGASALRMLDL